MDIVSQEFVDKNNRISDGIMKLLLALFIIFNNQYVDKNTISVSSETDQMKSVASEVLNSLKQAKGILPAEAPILSNVYRFRGGGKLASMYLDKGEIHLDSKTYRICRSMGADSLNALAFLLGHELGHFINKHGGINHNIEEAVPESMTQFAAIRNVVHTVQSDNSTSEFDRKLNDALIEYRETHDEAEADFEGAFLGYLAGYRTVEAGREFLKRAYKNLDIDTSTTGYPTLSERLAIVNKTSRELERLTPIFELSQYLTAIGQFADAIPLLEGVLEKFQSPEIYNNLGVLQLLHVQTLFKTPLSKYKFPLTLDAEFRAPHPQFFGRVRTIPGGHASIADWDLDQLPPTAPCELNLIQKRIETAENYFHKAIQGDSEYFLAHLNISIAHTLKAILFAPDYNKDHNPLLVRPTCEHKQIEEFNKAKSNIAEAINKCQQALSGICIEYFGQVPSDTMRLVSYPPVSPEKSAEYLRYAPPLDNSSDNQGTSRNNAFNRNIKQSYPSFMECFEEPSYSINEDYSTIAYTRWATPNYKIPEKGYSLSNIYMQADLINLLDPNRRSDSISYPYPHPRYMTIKAPFTRALEINPNNELAQFNQSKYRGLSIPANHETTSSNCDSIEKYNNKSITEIESVIDSWDHSESIAQSRVMPYFISDEIIESTEFNVVHHKLFNLTQEVHYADLDSLRLYVNSSTSSNGVVDKSILLIPDSHTSTKTACGISKRSKGKEMENKYGSPNRTIQTSKGQFNSYIIRSTTTQSQEEPNRDVWPPTEQSEVDRVEQLEDGLIFRLNNSNQVDGWIIYHRSTISTPYIEN